MSSQASNNPLRSLAEWTVDCGSEPRIRVGIVLPTDDMRMLTIDVRDVRYQLEVDGSPITYLSAGAYNLRGDGCRMEITDENWASIALGEVVRLTPLEYPRATSGAGVRLHDVLTGRGFHWQKRTDFTFQGNLEFRSFDGRMLAIYESGVEQYLPGVITAEMSGECPIEFLKSQCIVARSWVLAHSEPKHVDWPIDRCNDDCCQRFHGTTHLTERAVQAVTETRGQVVADASGRVIDANYSKSCGGIIEAPEYVWFTHKRCQREAVDAPVASTAASFLPIDDANLGEYLTGDWLANADVFCSPNVVPDIDLPRYLGSVDEGGGHFRWRIEYTREELENLLRYKLGHVFDERAKGSPNTPDDRKPILVADVPPTVVECRVPAMRYLRDLRVLSRGRSGRAYELCIDYESVSGSRVCLLVRSEYRIREALHERFLFSSAFNLEISRDASALPENITLNGAGWGHGAGLCQIGALGMALKGYACGDILRHYFEGVEILALY